VLRARDRGQLHTAAILIRGAQYVTNRLTQQIAVSPGFGGRLNSADGKVRVNFAPGTVAELAVASYRQVTETLPVPHDPIGPVFDLNAVWYGSGAPVESFLRPVTITVRYEEDDVAGVRETRLVLHYWGGSRWVKVPTTVEVSQNRAVAEVNHFTIYALLEREHIVYFPLVIRR